METAVYVHVPYCATKCHYCDFLSFPLSLGRHAPGEYLRLLETELSLRGRELASGGYNVTTLYIGGGTPTALTCAELDRLLSSCLRHLPLANPEWTVEVNPGTLDPWKAFVLSRHGVNRVSLGVQDLDNSRLALLGRTYTAAEACRAFTLCRENFASVAVDLLAGLPQQAADDFAVTLVKVLEWRPDHVSLYSLKLAEGTPLAAAVASGNLPLPEDDETADMLLAARELLAEAGYEHYEIANFALPGHACRHNLVYWLNKPYIGVGLGAHSHWGGKRSANAKTLSAYAALLDSGLPPVETEWAVTEREAMEDTLILGLRLLKGVGFSEFTARHGYDIRRVFAAELEYLLRLGLIEYDFSRIRLAANGINLANEVFTQFISGGQS
ncbi:MAG: Oxygen-independent coproporphyrinogen-III oxidase-like protein [Syntrophomonadaceae bacterium]|nr:Oxygen-independent coproporphyrinogen-III oxidase-like protein [Bacillota bacterium]